MHITLNIDTEQSLSALDLGVLGVLAGNGAAPVAAARQAASPTASAPAAKKAAATPVAAAPDPEPEPEVDLLGADTTAPTLQDAIDAATAVVAAGEPARIKAALDLVGAAKVRELTEEQVAPFLEAL